MSQLAVKAEKMMSRGNVLIILQFLLKARGNNSFAAKFFLPYFLNLYLHVYLLLDQLNNTRWSCSRAQAENKKRTTTKDILVEVLLRDQLKKKGVVKLEFEKFQFVRLDSV